MMKNFSLWSVLLVAVTIISITTFSSLVSAEQAPVKNTTSVAPKITSSPSICQPSEWIYVNGEKWSKTEKVSILFEFVNGHPAQTAACVVYGETSLGCTVPSNPPSFAAAKLFIVTETGGKSVNFNSIVVATPAGPPSINGFRSLAGPFNCYQYLYTDNAFVGSDALGRPNTQIFVNDNIEVQPTVYMAAQIGVTIPELAMYSEYTRKTGNITFTIKTKLGSDKCELEYKLKPVDGKGSFCS